MLWLWCRLTATALIRPLAWEPPYAARAAQEIAKRQKNKNKQTNKQKTTTNKQTKKKKLKLPVGLEGYIGEGIEGLAKLHEIHFSIQIC